jgi:hypothetical protein
MEVDMAMGMGMGMGMVMDTGITALPPGIGMDTTTTLITDDVWPAG